MVRDGSAPRVSTAGDGLCLGAAPHFRRGSLWQAVLEHKAEGLASAFLPGCCKKVWDQSSRLALHPRPRRPLIPSTPAQRLGVLFAHSPSHVSFPSMAAAPARAASVSRIAQRSLASRPAHSRGHPYVTRYPKASAITTQRKISARPAASRRAYASSRFLLWKRLMRMPCLGKPLSPSPSDQPQPNQHQNRS